MDSVEAEVPGPDVRRYAEEIDSGVSPATGRRSGCPGDASAGETAIAP